MNILIVSQYFWPERFKINDIAQGLIEKGHAVTVLTSIPNYPVGKFFNGYGLLGPYFENHNGIKVVRVPQFPRGNKKGIMLALNYLSFMLIASILGPILLLRKKFDRIFIYQLSPVTAAFPAVVMKWIKKCKLYFWVTDLWPESLVAAGVTTSPRILSLVGRFVKFMLDQSDLILLSSKGFTKNMIERGIDRSKLEYWPQWGEKLFYETLIEENKLPRNEVPEGFVIMFAGNIGTSQSFEIIVEAAERLSSYTDIHWVILGDGLKRAWIEKEVIDRGIEDCFHLLGSRPMDSIPYYYSLSSALLVSLKKDPIFSITLPTKVQSYLASGKPIIVSVDGEAADIVNENFCGVSCRASSVEDLVDGVLKLYSKTPEEREKMGANGREFFFKNFERELLLTKLENLMNLKN
ncbi:glycosyltransferase family 4 protein [Halobacteriovorax sp. HLS]|uniref:glycosyltransferase family 4 protein n=1 Tax=Halobacteriovorax sp. HLS TaxID=2234000 RepID=UPI000FD9955C|nr:glycosyltransferase family 4 protein [Halobacteriovorax sp. HLS]